MGTLFIVSTPIGNLGDITMRALETLFRVDIIASEDTRVTGKLLDLLQEKYKEFLSVVEKPKLIAYHNDNEGKVAPELIRLLEGGHSIALVSDAGTPLISDPGYLIVSEARKRDIPIVVVPGVSAFLTALTGSGLPIHTCTFVGYFPEKQGKRLAFLKSLAQTKALFPTYVSYVAPHKLHQTLLDMQEVFGNITIVISRELTKLHEEYWKGRIEEGCRHFSDPKGEFVLVFTLS